MKDINLLPKYYLDKQELHQFFLMRIANMAIIFLLLILIVIGLNATISVEKHRIIRYQGLLESSQYVQSENIAKELRRREERAEKAKNVFAGVYEGALIKLAHLDVVVDAMAVGMYATEIVLDYERSSIIFSGTSASKQDVAAFISNLENAAIFSDVELINISNTYTELVSFTLEIQIHDHEQ